MKNKFIPYSDKIVVKLLEKDSFIEQGTTNAGVVISVGNKVKFVKAGDTVFFSPWGLETTAKVDGNEYYIVPDSPNFIQGKYDGPKTKRVQ